MGYIFSIKNAIVMFPFIAFLFTIPFILVQYHKYGSINKLRVLIVYSFILYLMVIYFLVILPLPERDVVINMTSPKINFVPFTFVKDIIINSPLVINDSSTYISAITNKAIFVALFNIIMTIPLGMYLKYYFKCSLKKTILISFLVSLFFELTQLSGLYFIYPRPYRLCDVDDLILNTSGGLIGYFIMGLFKHLPTRDKIDEDSIKKGMVVSGLRRFTLFFLDVFIMTFIISFVNLFIGNKYIGYIVFIIYYIVIPFIYKGYTLGGKFLNVRLSFKNKIIFRLALRIILIYVYYFFITYSLIYLSIQIFTKYSVDAKIEIYYCIIFGILFLLFYLINVILVLRNKQLIYDKIVKTKYISTIGYRTNK